MGVIPSPDVNWIWGFVCDEGPKTDEFIRIYYDSSWNTYIMRLPHDQPLGTEEDEIVERVGYLAAQLKEGFNFVEESTGLKVSETALKEVGVIWQRYYQKLGELNRLIASDPQPISGLIGGLFFMPLTAPFNTGIEWMEKALDITIEEVKEKVRRKEGILDTGSPKLMVHIMPITLPWISKMFEENGVGLAFGEISAPSKKQLAPPRFEDPYMAAAETWLKRSSTINTGYRVKVICEKLKTYGIDGMIFGFFDFDRWIGSDHRLLARMVEERTNLPVFYIEGDFWDDRDYSPEALRTRIESICEVIKMRKTG
jgi:benzoyl-CoA reductase/2-hydroxyglutaryl-CoA dehydratase subunit BcrC/BadD/HgdB